MNYINCNNHNDKITSNIVINNNHYMNNGIAYNYIINDK